MEKNINNEEVIVIEDIKIYEYMELLDEIRNFWHGQPDHLEYYDEVHKISSILSKPQIDFYQYLDRVLDGCVWSDEDCQAYAEAININQWKKIEWDTLSLLITKYDRLDFLIELFREQILIFYKMGFFENDPNFRQIVLQFIDDFDKFSKFYWEDGMNYIYYEGFCKTASAMYKNNFSSAKNIFIEFSNVLNDKCKSIKKENFNKTLVKSLIMNISKRR